MYILLIVLAIIYVVFICYQLLQFYYMVNPYKACLLSSNTKNVAPELLNVIQKYCKSTEDKNFIELGSGKGNISRYISKSVKFKQIIGIEGDFITYLTGKALSSFGSYPDLNLIYKDIFKYQIPDGENIIYLYLFPKLIKKLYERGYFKNSLVISLSFSIDDESLKPTEEVIINNFQKKLIIYDFRE